MARSRANMEKRDFKRIDASLETHYLDIRCFGTVTNISGNGMFIKSPKIIFPLNLQFEISLPFKEEMLNVPVINKRLSESNGYYDGMGVEVLNIQKNYLELLIKLNLCSEL
jgi:hypothetical protein